MKTRILVVSLLLASLCIVTSCQSKKSEDKKAGAAKVETPAASVTKEEIRAIIKSMPTQAEVIKLVNSTGAAYLAGFTNENLKTENLLTRADKTKALGAVLFDMSYTHLYRQVEPFNKLLTISETLTKELGFEELVESFKQFKTEFDKNKDNQVVLDTLFEGWKLKIKKLLYTSSSVQDLSLVYCGGVIKSLNVISYLTLFAPQKEQLLVVLKNQKGLINSACEVLAKSPADPEISKYLETLTPINKIFQSSEPLTEKSIEEINKLTGTAVK